MPVRLCRLRALFLLTLAVALCAQVPPGYRDENEYNLMRAIRVQPSAQRQLELLRRWQQLYPASAKRQERFQLTIEALRSLGRGREMQQTALAMAADNPRGQGPYWVALLAVDLRDTSAEGLRQAEKAAQSLLAAKSSETVAHRALGWIAMCRGQWRDAETEFRLVLLRDSNDAEATYWLGTSMLSAGAGREEALSHVARSLEITGRGELSPEEKLRARSFLEQASARRAPSR